MPLDDATRARLVRGFSENVPHNRALGIQIHDLSKAGGARLELPYDAKLVGNPETGVLHGGAITSLLDSCSGAAVFAALVYIAPIATLDLRIDYLKPATPGKSVIAHAHCYKLTKSVAFTRAIAYHDDPGDPIASAAGTFMLSTKVGSAAAKVADYK
jgi:uncharacterized protein (TIGR00369 family)